MKRLKRKLINWIVEDIKQEIWDVTFPERKEILTASYNAGLRLRQVLEHLHPLSAAQIILDENEIPKTVVKSRICECCGYRYFKQELDGDK